MLLASTGCQVILGDFTLDQAPSETAAELGDACDPNAYQCAGNELQTCSPDRQAFTAVAECMDADHCDPAAGACRACTPGDVACNGPVLETCGVTGQWQSGTTCATAALCSVAVDRRSGSCAPSPCGQGEHTCSGNRLLRCSSGHDALSFVDRCASAALCDPVKADDQVARGGRGTCQPPHCLIGQFACDGATLKRCNDDLNGWVTLTTCGDATSCNPMTGSCAPCNVGDTACSGAELWRCAATGFAKVENCAAPELCNASAGECDKPTCSAPGAVRCVKGELNKLEECGNDLRWAVREVCASGVLCSETAARCLPPACESDETRCEGQQHQSCSGDLSQWVVDQTCAPDETCDPSGCLPNPCVEGSVRCNDVALERCVSGVWTPQNRCAAPALCNVTKQACDPPCDASLGEYSCVSGNIKQCASGVSVDFLTCNGQFCDPDPAVGKGLPTCDVCQPLAYSCVNGSELHRCVADGSVAPLVERCSGGCSVTGGVPTCAQTP
jgi:hypothetical protein